jgi:hypothetical protein
MRTNKRQHIAQTLRFEWPLKQGIIEVTRAYPAGSMPGAYSEGAGKRDQTTNLVYRIWPAGLPLEESFVAETVVKLRLNQQQLELMDRTIAQGIAPDRVSLVRLALREYVAARKAESNTGPAR